MPVVSLLCAAPLFAFEPNSYMPKAGEGSSFGGGQKIEKNRTTQEPRVYTGQFGLGVRLGVAQNNPKDMKDAYDEAFDWGYSQKELTRNNGVFGVEVFHEWELEQPTDMLGVRWSYEGYGKNKLSLDWGDEKLEETSYAFPLTVYYKKNNGIKHWSFLAGAGVTLICSELQNKVAGYDESKTKVFPHITVGAEYRFTEVFALGLDVKYNIAAKVKKDGDVLSDRSGIGAALTGRFYF